MVGTCCSTVLKTLDNATLPANALHCQNSFQPSLASSAVHAGGSHVAGPAGQDRPGYRCHQWHRHGDSGSAGRCARVHREQRGRVKAAVQGSARATLPQHSPMGWIDGCMGSRAEALHLALAPSPCKTLSPPTLTISSNQAGMQAHSESCHHLLAHTITCPAATYSDAPLTNQST